MQHSFCVGTSYDFFGGHSCTVGLILYNGAYKYLLGGHLLALEGKNGGFSNFEGWPENYSI